MPPKENDRPREQEEASPVRTSEQAGHRDGGWLCRANGRPASALAQLLHKGGPAYPCGESPAKSDHVDAPVETITVTGAEQPDMIEVVDPTHPLFGRRFPVLRICQPPHGPGFVEVVYLEHFRLRLALNVTDRAVPPLALPRTKLTLEAIEQLIALVKECSSSCPGHPASSGPDSPRT